tara:strand:- start:203 stop:415 length:213 start_codon:yes stop_codon:yes gene_type:complete
MSSKYFWIIMGMAVIVTYLALDQAKHDLDNHVHGGNHHLSGTGSTVQHLEVIMPGIKTDKKTSDKEKAEA